MAGPAEPSGKKQSFLTSFFTPRTINGLTQVDRPATSPSPATPTAVSSRKRPLGGDTDNGNGNESASGTRKRAKGRGVAEEVDETGDNVMSDEPPAKVSARTERYVYSASRPDRTTGESAEGELDSEDEDQAARRQKEELHCKFVKKLGHPDSMTRFRSRSFPTKAGPVVVDSEDGEDGEGEEAHKEERPLKAKKKGAKTGKLTPMEIQFLDIKRKHMDTVLITEVGYKFKFFGEDARTAAKELGIVCIPGKMRYDEHPSEAHLDRFASASIPVHRLPVHAKRLVAAGHKVGVVRQIETAALKKAGDNRNAPFDRKLTDLYTKGTYVDDLGDADGHSRSSAGGYLLCITEFLAKGAGTDENVNVGIVAVQPATGDVVYDEFEDGFMRREIETRLLHISPCEFLIVGEPTKASEKLMQHLSASSTNVFGERSRVERVARPSTMAADARTHVARFYADKAKHAAAGDGRAAALLDQVLNLPDAVTVCLSAIITHLTEYGLEHVFGLTRYFQSFSTSQHMLINGTTLESLEVYRNAADHSERGSVVWALDKTQTRFGQRLLRKWVGRPLLDRDRIERRVQAVEELLKKGKTAAVDKIGRLLGSVKVDLERSLIRIYYGKCTRPELLATLQTLHRLATEFSRLETPQDSAFQSPCIRDALCSCSLSVLGDVLTSHLDKIDVDAARRDDKYAFFREGAETDDIETHRLGIVSVEQDLDAHRATAAEELARGGKSAAALEYVTVAGIEYLIQVPNSDLKRVPASWVKISGTKKVSRFHTPEVISLINERDQHKEALAAACDAAFDDLLRAIATDYQPLRDAVASLATLDCLLSLSRLASSPGYTRPTFLPSSSPPTISITEGRHPVAELTLPSGYIPFTTTLSSPSPLAHLITGPNMGGKSSYVRAVALLVLLAQIGSFVPASAMTLTLADAIHTRMGARDNLFAGESTFMVEVGETATILRAATPRSLVVLDELGRGTSTHDGAAIAHAVLHYVVREARCLTLFITHYQNLAWVAQGLGDGLVKCLHMRFTTNRHRDDEGQEGDDEDNADPVNDNVTFLYEVAEGVAHRSYGLNVARLARIPQSVLRVAAFKSREIEGEIRRRRLRGAARLLEDLLQSERSVPEGVGPNQLETLIAAIEQL